jgi:LacI family transcriptional regulator
VDGYIITPPENILVEIGSLIAAGLPVVLFDRNVPDLDCDSVVINNEQSTYDATKHLLGQGYKNIAFITLNSSQSQMQERLAGYERALTEKKLPVVVKKLSYSSTTHSEELTKHITAFLKKKPELDAVIFGTNYIGVSGLKAIRNIGLRIPEDLAVIAFDDHDVFQLNSPSITAIAQPIEKISEKLITLLLGRLTASTQPKAGRNIVLPAELIIRNSSRK